MTGPIASRYGEFVASRSRAIVLVLLVATVLIGAGVTVGESDEAELGEFEVDSPETRAADFIEDNYRAQDGVLSQYVVRDRGGDVLTLESMRVGLAFQQAVRDDPTLEGTLADRGLLGLENVVATAAHFRAGADPAAGAPTLQEQRRALDRLDADSFDSLLSTVLDPQRETPGETDPAEFLPAGYEPGSTESEARLGLVRQADESAGDGTPQVAYDAQVEIDRLLEQQFDDAFLFGQGVRDDASSRATGDSFTIITPFILVLILLVLGVAYRDVLDILLALFGIAVVLVWQAGIMGWLGIPMNVILIAVPFLLVGLSIDYALHVVMRYREARSGRLEPPDEERTEPTDRTASDEERTEPTDRTASDDDRPSTNPEEPRIRIQRAMGVGLGSVVLAIAAATFSTGVGFFSNVVSPLPAIRDFAILAAGGIVATFVVFGVLVPALKVELDTLVERRLGRDRQKPAFGVGRGLANGLLSRLAGLASRSPLAVIAVALLLTTGGVYGATGIDTEFNQADFLPEDPPEWTSSLPGPFEPGSYSIADEFAYLNENFALTGPDDRTQILIRGNVTDPAVLNAIETATANVGQTQAIARRPDGTPAVEGPTTLLRDEAAENESLAAAIEARDTTGNGLPDEDVAPVYDRLFAADQQAASELLSRDGTAVTSVRLLVSVRGEESAQTVADDTRALADAIERTAPNVTAVAANGPVGEAVLQDALLENLVQAFSVTLVVIFLFLTVLFWRQYGAPLLGAVVLVPVVAALAWLLGAMALLEIPFNSETAVVTSLAIGLGVDYSIHAGERFVTERERQDSLEATLVETITGTGGALLASAGTTAAAFGVLALSLSPPLQRFGIVTGSAIVFAFISCVTVLPCLLVVRERFAGRLTR